MKRFLTLEHVPCALTLSSRHEGAVWCVSWVRSPHSPPKNLLCFDLLNKQAHPKYGSILASSSYDGKVLIWRESPNSQWTIVANFALHTASVNIVSWSPHESGCLLACASSDGQVSILEFQEGNWTHQIFPAHGQGVNAVSWAPATQPGSLVSSKPGVEGKGAGGGVRRFVTGGSDGVVKIWDYKYALLQHHSRPICLLKTLPY